MRAASEMGPWMTKKFLGVEVPESEQYKYPKFLNQVNESTGLLAELYRLQHGSPVQGDKGFDEYTAAFDTCNARGETCLGVCLENFTKSSVSYNKTWQVIWSFLERSDDEPIPEDIMACLAKQDSHSPSFTDADHTRSHMTGFTVSEEDHAMLVQTVRQLDKEHFDSRLHKIELEWGC